MTSLLIVMKKTTYLNVIITYIHTHVRTYIHTYIHKLYLNTNLSVAKKAETKVKLSDKSPNSHEKKTHISMLQ